MTTVYLLQAEHFSNPGRITKIFATEGMATAEAARLANLMRDETALRTKPLHVGPEGWQHMLKWLQDVHGASNCYIEVTPQRIIGQLIQVEEA